MIVTEKYPGKIFRTFATHMYARDTTTHPRFPPTESRPCIAAYRHILLILKKNCTVDLFGLVVDHSSCAAPTSGSKTAVEPSLNQLSIDVGVEGVSSMCKRIFLSPTMVH